MIKSYDFKSPKKLTKKRMDTVENLYDSSARALAPYLTGLPQSFYKININGTVEKRYQEFSSSVQDHSLFDVITTSPVNRGYNGASLAMEVDIRLAFFMIERLLGGVESEYDLSRDFTDTEKAILWYALEKITEFLGGVWGQYLDIEASLTGLRTNPRLLQMSTQKDVVTQVGLEVVIEKLRTRVNMVVPAPDVEELTSRFDYSFAASREKQDEDKQKSKWYYIEQHLLGSEAELRVISHELTLDVQGILQFAPGDVIPFSEKMDSAISLYVEGVACFEARAGRTKMHRTVKISRELQPGGKGTLSMDKEAIKELTEMKAVPIYNILGSPLGRNVKMSMPKVEKTDMGPLAEGLPHFNVAMENRKAMGGMSADQPYAFARGGMVRLTDYIIGVPVDAQSPLDEIAPSTLREVVSQCVGVAMDELNDFLGKDMRDTITRISVLDNTERIQDIIRSWNAGNSVLLIGLHYAIDRVVESDVYIVVAQILKQVLGISDMTDMPRRETRGQISGMPAAGMQTAEYKEVIAVQEMFFPEFKYTPIVYAKEQIGEGGKKLLDITLDVSIRLGSTVCSIEDILSLKEGQLLILDKQASSPADAVVNGELIGRGDVLVTEDRSEACIIEAVGERE